MKINVLGRPYAVTVSNDGEEKRLTGCDGFCDETSAEIYAENYAKAVSDPCRKADLSVQTKKVIRHEIVHAFLFESGLSDNSPWAQDEEMVDWIAIQGPKMYAAWREAGASDA